MTTASPRVKPGRHLLRYTVLRCAVFTELDIKSLVFQAEACILLSSPPPAHPSPNLPHSCTLDGIVVCFQGGGACPQARPVQEGSPQRAPAGARSQPGLPSRPPSKYLSAFARCLFAFWPKWQGFAICATLFLIRTA